VLQGNVIKYVARCIACCYKIQKDCVFGVYMKIGKTFFSIKFIQLLLNTSTTVRMYRVTAYSYRSLSFLFSFLHPVSYMTLFYMSLYLLHNATHNLTG
jgi:hypothetical protein